VPVGQFFGQQPRRPSRWRALTQWRSWSIPVKLSAVTLVPIVIALVLGVITINDQVGRSDSYQRVGRLAAVNSDVRNLLDGVQRERTQTVQQMITGSTTPSPDLATARKDVDTSTAALKVSTKRALDLDQSISGASDDATAQLGTIAGLRERLGTGQLDPNAAINGYTAVTEALLKFDTSLTAGISNDAIGGTPNALHDLQVVKEELSYERGMVLHGIARGVLTPGELDQLRSAEIRLGDRLDEFRAAASDSQRQDYDNSVNGPDNNTRDALVKIAVSGNGNPKSSPIRDINPQQWADSSLSVILKISDVSKRLGQQVDASSAKLVEDSSSGAGLLAVLLFAALVLAAAVVFLISRELLRSLRVLRVSALDVAQRQLPAAVLNIQEGREQSTEVQRVPVADGDEIGEVARAFDTVHSQALRLAVEQAAMRTGYSSVFVNLSRRSQSLVQRQLQMIERLERDEEDADQLATLFQLDHLATRMRRNNENLMVLSGSEPTRRSGQPVTATDVLRAAVSEIEQYQRVSVQTPPNAKIVGYAASDMMRLIAELLDNATAFSAPETKVTVSTRFDDDGALVVEIMDQGIGMNEMEVSDANARLSEPASVDLATSRRMGLFVVGRLASRHNIRVYLHGGKEMTGVRATVAVPPELVMGTSEVVSSGGGSTTFPPSPPEDELFGGGDPGSLPRRQPSPVNGATRPSGLSGLDPAGASVPAQSGGGADRSFADGLSGNSYSDGGFAGGGGGYPGTAYADDGYGDRGYGDPGYPDQGYTEADWPEGPDSEVEPPSDLEVSGTALFSPIEREEQDYEPTPPPPPPPQPPSSPPPMPKRRSRAERESSQEELPSGSALFAANENTLNDWWNTAPPASSTPSASAPATEEDAEAERERRLTETTPIFDETLSAWFREPGQPPPESARPETPATTGSRAEAPGEPGRRAEPGAERSAAAQAGSPVRDEQATESAPSAQSVPSVPSSESESSSEDWAFASDEGWRTVQQVSESQPSDFTSAGLPRRRRGEQLLPGTAATSGPPGQSSSAEQPRAVGRSEGAQAQAGPAGQPARSGAESPEGSGLPARDPSELRGRLNSFQQGVNRGRQARHSADAPPAQSAEQHSQSQPEQPEQHSQSEPLPHRQPRQPQSMQPQQQAPRTESEPLPQRQQSEPLPHRQPSGQRRVQPSPQPRQQPAPEQQTPQSPAPDPQAPQPSAPQPQAQQTQYLPSGGQSALPQRGQAQQPRTESGVQRAASPAEPAQAPVEWPEPGSGGTSAPAGEKQAERSGAWSFASDDGWQTVRSVSDSAPSSYTSAGLPRRQRGEKLMPGSAMTASASAASRQDRDPQDVRGRLSSFQQGIRRGRHRSAQPGEGNQETMEGE
jgi:signal transduction histidine kinase